ncbi:uncharacterized protein apol isoform X1 [Esox lucius]|uniref:Uncharacterized protein n=1 Tax=Esox lucius TaxID=8010 RepID=A0A3P8YS55_ESOLU|nr:uncharacterized protein apol isoform X1 [Esox lucius]
MSKLVESAMSRSKLIGELLVKYVFDTLCHIETVREFCERHYKWVLLREGELEMMKDIQKRAERINLKFADVRNSTTKFKAFGEYILSGLNASRKLEALEKELDAVLKDTLDGMEKLDCFLLGAECLAVTCLSVFDENTFLCLPQGMSPASVQAIITDARKAYPLLIHFKRDAKDFFMPSLFNVEVLTFQLDRYIQFSKQLCNTMEQSSSICRAFCKNNKNSVVNLGEDLSEESLENMLQHLNQLNDIRMDQDFRMAFLFHDMSQRFIDQFKQCQPRMEKFLTELGESAMKLDRMKKGAKISSVAGSSLGLTGGVLSIVGIALSPVTAGVSLGLTIAGVSLGVTSGVNSITTCVTEFFVNRTNQKKASEVFQRFMEDVERLQECMEDVARNREPILGRNKLNDVLVAGKVIATAGAVGKAIDSMVDCVSAVKVLGTENLCATVGMVTLQEGQAARSLSKLAGDIPDIGQVAKGTPLALGKAARVGFITLNALFIGLDAFFICKDSINLAKGSKSEISQFLCARSVLWRKELESWQRINDLLCRGILKIKKCQEILEQPFYPLEERS